MHIVLMITVYHSHSGGSWIILQSRTEQTVDPADPSNMTGADQPATYTVAGQTYQLLVHLLIHLLIHLLVHLLVHLLKNSKGVRV